MNDEMVAELKGIKIAIQTMPLPEILAELKKLNERLERITPQDELLVRALKPGDEW